jgi:surface antigen
MPVTQPLEEQNTTAHLTRVLTRNDSPRVTRLLIDRSGQTDALNQLNPTTTALRQPVVIPGSGKKSTGIARPPRGRKWVINTAVLAVIAVLALVTAQAVAPLATGNAHSFSLFASFGSVHNNNDSALNADLVAQAATATAIVRQDGYDPNSNSNSSSSAPPTYSGSGVTPDRFAYGNCTYWADIEYHNLTGYWVAWIGNADQWAGGASAAGWIVSSTPHVPSIIVLQPYVQGAGGFGHVAVVLKINSDGSVLTSNMNWYANGGWNIVSDWTFTPGPGVSFVWHP